MYRNNILTEENKRTKIVHSKKYLDWLVEFTESQPNCSWDDEAVQFSPYFSNYDKKYATLLPVFQSELEKMAKEQFVLSLTTNKYEYVKYHFKLRGQYYETIILDGNGRISAIKKIDEPSDNFIFVDEKLPIEIKKERELVEFILINKDIELTPQQYAVHIAHVCTQAAVSEFKTEKFKIWYQSEKNQKKIILKAPQSMLEKLEDKFYASRDIGHNNIAPNALVAVSLGVLNREDAKCYTNECELWK